ncbi:MAG: helix-turn-helix domain-containing protein [Oscillospiraceae bacterium]|nr:helix-turn-helix domain-containing protein [Oscillospiraceae bacterium]
MAARLTDRQKKKIIADYVQFGSYSTAGKMNGVSRQTVKRIVADCADLNEKLQQKKEENTADIIEYMERQKNSVCKILDICLNELENPDKYAKVPPQQIATTMAILIDKYTADNGRTPDTSEAEDDALTASLKELAKELEKND